MANSQKSWQVYWAVGKLVGILKKLMEENATLYKLKELEYLEKICDKVGNISVGGGNLLTELREIISVK